MFTLKKKLTIGIYAPAFPAHILFKDKYNYGIKVLISMGFDIIEGKLIKNKNIQGYRTANGQERALEFMELINNPKIDIIMPVTGGLNSSSLIPYLDFKKIDASNKILCGYSDITSLQMSIISQTNLKCIYGGAVISTFGEFKDNDYAKKSFISSLSEENYELIPPIKWSNILLNAFTNDWKDLERTYFENQGWKVINHGYSEGIVYAANINTLVSLFGSKYIPDFTNSILILEEEDATINIEERSLNALKLYGVFDNLKGLIFGKPEIYDDKNSNITYKELIKEIVGKREYPIIYDFDCAHTIPSICIPQRSRMILDATSDKVKIFIKNNIAIKS
ncbi:MAG: S66 family peptidase [Fusobacteriaceae bacterium]